MTRIRKWTADQILEQLRGWTAARNGEPDNPHETRHFRYGHMLYRTGRCPNTRFKRAAPVTLSSQMSQIQKRPLT